MNERRMFGRESLDDALRSIGEQLRAPVTVHLIGGCAMAFMGAKPSTKDIDAVLTSKRDVGVFSAALERTGFHKTRPASLEYQKLGTRAIFRRADNMQFDVFERIVCRKLEITERMVSRSRRYAAFGPLEVRLISAEDIFLFKGMTEREGDLEDMRILAERGLNWDVVKEECLRQKKRLIWESFLLDRLVDLERRFGIKSPIAKELLASADFELLKVVFRKIVGEGYTTFEEIAGEVSKRLGYSTSWTRKQLRGLVKAQALHSTRSGRRVVYSVK
ncbi:MAG: hypothetical protein AABX97_01960 [Candidatus Thermoplasmatota archaeon]